MNKKVTIIVPIYNTIQYLPRCIESILSQTYENFELICVDDCSTDGCLSILEKYKKLYPNKIKIISNEQNIGQGKSRMKGIASSEGEYIFFIDSDDYIDKNYVSIYISQVESFEYDVVVGGFIQDNKGKIYYNYVDNDIRAIISYSHACCKMYKKSFILENNINFGDFRKGEDIFFSLLLVLCGASHKFIHYAGYYYVVNNMSTTHTISYDNSFEKAVSEMFDKLMASENYNKASKENKQYIEYAYVAGMINALVTYNHGCKWGIMKGKYHFFIEDLKEKFVGYKDDDFLYKWYKQGPSLKCRLGVYITMNAMKFHVDKIIYRIIASKK